MSSRTDIIVRNVPETVQRKMMKQKEDDGFGDKDWTAWFAHLVVDVHLRDSPSEMIQKNTRNGLLEVWVKNLGQNLAKIWNGNTISDLVPPEANALELEGKDPDVPVPGKSAIVIGRGPSLRKHKHLEMLRDSAYRGTLVVTDGALIETLEAGIRPPEYDLFCVMTVDGNHEKIWKWYDHPLVDEFGPSIKAAICTSCSPNVVERLEKAKAKYFWFHPIYDDWRNNESYTKIEQLITKSDKLLNGVPAMQAGGHAGAAAWVLAWVVLRRNPVALVGIDLGYLPEDDLTKTYYWNGIYEAVKGDAAVASSQYGRLFNPDTKTEAVVDPVFAHYRHAFLEMLATTPPWLMTINATEGGALFGEGVTAMKFGEFLERYKR